MYKRLLLLILVVSTGCVSTAESKVASASTGAALKSLEQAETTFANLYAAEIDKTIALVGDAVIAKAVKVKISNEADKVAQGNLIALSEEIEATQDAVSRLVHSLIASPPTIKGEANSPIADYLRSKARSLRKTAIELQNAGFVQEAAELEARADALEAGQPFVSQALDGDLEVIVRLADAKSKTAQNLKALKTHTKAITAMHEVINEWIMTDATVSGKDLAALLEKNAALFGLDSKPVGDK